MKKIIAVQSQNTQNNKQENNEFPVIGNGGVNIAIAIVSILIGKWMPWGEIAKQITNVRTSKILSQENRTNQELEAEIDINKELSDTVSNIATRGVEHSSAFTKDLLHLVSDAIHSSSANAQSLQSLAKANESVNKAHEDLIQATVHNNEAIKSLEEAISIIPAQTGSIIEIYATEFRTGMDLLDDRLDKIEKNQKIYSSQIKEEFSSAFLELRRALKV